jgi:hypothetical protein
MLGTTHPMTERHIPADLNPKVITTLIFLPNNNLHIQKLFLNTVNIFCPSQMPKLGTSRVQYV